MTPIKLTFTGDGSFVTPFRARIAVGDHFLSAECASATELQAQVNFLKSRLDKLVYTAKGKFASKKR
jgi:hypothetical protein